MALREISIPDSHVVRRFGSEKTHVKVVTSVRIRKVFGAEYLEPNDGHAACGVKITEGVVMRPGTVTRCTACRHITGITEEGP